MEAPPTKFKLITILACCMLFFNNTQAYTIKTIKTKNLKIKVGVVAPVSTAIGVAALTYSSVKVVPKVYHHIEEIIEKRKFEKFKIQFKKETGLDFFICKLDPAPVIYNEEIKIRDEIQKAISEFYERRGTRPASNAEIWADKWWHENQCHTDGTEWMKEHRDELILAQCLLTEAYHRSGVERHSKYSIGDIIFGTDWKDAKWD